MFSKRNISSVTKHIFNILEYGIFWNMEYFGLWNMEYFGIWNKGNIVIRNITYFRKLLKYGHNRYREDKLSFSFGR